MKNTLISLSLCLALTACGNSSPNSSGSDKSGNSGGGVATPAKSNLDTTNDSTHGTGHTIGAIKPQNTDSTTAK